MALNFASLNRWTLRGKALHRRFALRYVSNLQLTAGVMSIIAATCYPRLRTQIMHSRMI